VILQAGRYGALVPVGDDEELAKAMASTLDAPPPPAELKKAARPYAIETATDAYLSIMGLPPRPSGKPQAEQRPRGA